MLVAAETETVGISSRSSDEASACEGRRPLTSLRRRDDGMMHHSRFGSLTELIERPTMGSMMRDALCTHRRVILRVLSRLLEQGPRAWLLPHVFTDTLHAVCKVRRSLFSMNGYRASTPSLLPRMRRGR